MIHLRTYALHTDTIDYLQMLAKSMSETLGDKKTEGDAITWLVEQHWKKTQVKLAKQKKRNAVPQKRIIRP